jgi:hypothetical protein
MLRRNCYKRRDSLNTIPSHLVINAAIEKKFGAKYKLTLSVF